MCAGEGGPRSAHPGLPPPPAAGRGQARAVPALRRPATALRAIRPPPRPALRGRSRRAAALASGLRVPSGGGRPARAAAIPRAQQLLSLDPSAGEADSPFPPFITLRGYLTARSWLRPASARPSAAQSPAEAGGAMRWYRRCLRRRFCGRLGQPVRQVIGGGGLELRAEGSCGSRGALQAEICPCPTASTGSGACSPGILLRSPPKPIHPLEKHPVRL